PTRPRPTPRQGPSRACAGGPSPGRGSARAKDNPKGGGPPPDHIGARASAVVPPSNRPVGMTVRGEGARPDRTRAPYRSRKRPGGPAWLRWTPCLDQESGFLVVSTAGSRDGPLPRRATRPGRVGKRGVKWTRFFGCSGVVIARVLAKLARSPRVGAE